MKTAEQQNFFWDIILINGYGQGEYETMLVAPTAQQARKEFYRREQGSHKEAMRIRATKVGSAHPAYKVGII